MAQGCGQARKATADVVQGFRLYPKPKAELEALNADTGWNQALIVNAGILAFKALDDVGRTALMREARSTTGTKRKQ
jgi:hypothetical protein